MFAEASRAESHTDCCGPDLSLHAAPRTAVQWVMRTTWIVLAVGLGFGVLAVRSRALQYDPTLPAPPEPFPEPGLQTQDIQECVDRLVVHEHHMFPQYRKQVLAEIRLVRSEIEDALERKQLLPIEIQALRVAKARLATASGEPSASLCLLTLSQPCPSKVRTAAYQGLFEAYRREERRPEMAEALLHLIGSCVDREIPDGWIINDPSRALRHWAARELSSTFEAMGDPARAHEWARKAKWTYPMFPMEGGCGNVVQSYFVGVENRIAETGRLCGVHYEAEEEYDWAQLAFGPTDSEVWAPATLALMLITLSATALARRSSVLDVASALWLLVLGWNRNVLIRILFLQAAYLLGATLWCLSYRIPGLSPVTEKLEDSAAFGALMFPASYVLHPILEYLSCGFSNSSARCDTGWVLWFCAGVLLEAQILTLIATSFIRPPRERCPVPVIAG